MLMSAIAKGEDDRYGPIAAICWEEDLNPDWEAVKEQFLGAVPAQQRPQVAVLVSGTDARGRGLRTWLRLVAAQEQPCLEKLPAELVQVYLEDDEALPLHDCAGCGVAMPVRPDWRGFESAPQEVYFPICPCCGERTGLYAAWSRCPAAAAEIVAAR